MKTKCKTVIAILIILIFARAATCAEAGTRLAWIGTRTGWVTINGDIYYIHKTSGTYYKKGEPCWDEYRWHRNKLYYFGHNGKMLKHSTRYIKLNQDHSVRFIYIPGTNRSDRYSTRLKRYQKRLRNGRWAEYGMQTNIQWMCDWQR